MPGGAMSAENQIILDATRHEVRVATWPSWARRFFLAAKYFSMAVTIGVGILAIMLIAALLDIPD